MQDDLLPSLARLQVQPQAPRLHQSPANGADTRQLASDKAHPPRATNIHELRAMQKVASRRRTDETSQAAHAESLSQTLASHARRAGPRVIRGDQQQREDYHPGSPRTTADTSSGFVKAMSDAGLRPVVVYHNLSPAELYEKALQHEPSSHIVAGGALATVSGAVTGRTPRDKRVVREPSSEGDVWWGAGSHNYEMDERTFTLNRERAVDYLNQLGKLYVCDGYAGWDPASRYKIRVVCGRPYHALFAHNMLIRPTEEELALFGRPDFTIYNAGAFPANRFTSYMTSPTSVDVSFGRRELVILGSQYAGCMKQGLFMAMNYWLPKHQGALPLNAGCNVGADGGVALFLGLSGTGKTTFSTDTSRRLLSDDIVAWSPAAGVFGIEGGCYAKCIGLSKDKEPHVAAAIRFGAVLENVCFDEDSREVDFDAAAITENTRAAYPIEHMGNALVPCVAGHPSNLVLLCCDTFGVLPSVSRLTLEQALFYFVSGFTAKVAGTEEGVGAPQATFSPCYTAASSVWHPMKYAAMLRQLLEKRGAATAVWLLNTGFCGGPCGTGARIPLAHTKALVAAIHSGALAASPTATLPVFNLRMPTSPAADGVLPELLHPGACWADQEAYGQQLRRLAALFAANFKQFEDGGGHVPPAVAAAIAAAGPAPDQ